MMASCINFSLDFPELVSGSGKQPRILKVLDFIFDENNETIQHNS
jgi:hypothetical protein